MYIYTVEKCAYQINRNKFHNELGKLEINYAFMHDDNGISLIFQEIEQHTTTQDEGKLIVTYTKNNYVDVLDEDGEVIRQEKVFIDFTTEMLGIIAEIEKKVLSHEPLDIVESIYNELAELDKIIPRWGEDSLGGKQTYGDIAKAIQRKKELRQKLNTTRR